MFTSKEQTRDQMKQDLNQMKNTGAAIEENLGELAQEAGQYARRVVNATNEAAKAGISDATTAVKTQVRENPIQSTVIAAGVGFMLGFLLRR